MPVSLPGLERLISVLKKHGVGVDPKPPSPKAPRAGELVLGEPYDPQLAAVHARFGGGRFGDFILLDVEGLDVSLVNRNEELRRGWETLEPRLKRLFRYGQRLEFGYDFATVPSLAGAGGVQPVVYLIDYGDKPMLPIASSVDHAFDLWAHECDFCLKEYGAVGMDLDIDHVFPWAQVAQIAKDEELVRMLEEDKFKELLVADERDWVEQVIAAARG